MRVRQFVLARRYTAAAAVAALMACANPAPQPVGALAHFSDARNVVDPHTFDPDTIIAEATACLGTSAREGLDQVLSKVFAEQGRPNGYIVGEEPGGSPLFGHALWPRYSVPQGRQHYRGLLEGASRWRRIPATAVRKSSC